MRGWWNVYNTPSYIGVIASDNGHPNDKVKMFKCPNNIVESIRILSYFLTTDNVNLKSIYFTM